jgi:O-succinylbenzoic acid--CoA ligase
VEEPDSALRAGGRHRRGAARSDGPLDDARTKARFTELDGQRWYRTDDSGEFEVTGAFAGEILKVTGRRDRVIISGGVKVSLVGIEDVVRNLPGVTDVSAAAIPDEEWGQRPVLGVETEPGASVTEAAISAAIESALGRICVPDTILFGPLPRTANGKPDNRALTAAIRR